MCKTYSIDDIGIFKHDRFKTVLFEKAVKKYGKISPCLKKSIDDCFTEEFGFLIFWFNDSDNSTRIVKKRILSKRVKYYAVFSCKKIFKALKCN